ncbi:hypothetical protein D3C87_102070 [compost metagenome]
MKRRSGLVTLSLMMITGISAQAQSSASVNVFKELDGRVARCQGAKDVGQKSYVLRDMAAQNVREEGFTLTFTKQNLKCLVQKDGMARWTEVTEAELSSEKVSDAQGAKYVVNIERPEVIAMTDDYKVMVGKNDDSKSTENVAIDVRTVDVIGKEGEEEFKRTGRAAVKLNVYSRGVVTYTSEAGEKFVVGVRTGGNFRVTVNLSKDTHGFMGVKILHGHGLPTAKK